MAAHGLHFLLNETRLEHLKRQILYSQEISSNDKSAAQSPVQSAAQDVGLNFPGVTLFPYLFILKSF